MAFRARPSSTPARIPCGQTGVALLGESVWKVGQFIFQTCSLIPNTVWLIIKRHLGTELFLVCRYYVRAWSLVCSPLLVTRSAHLLKSKSSSCHPLRIKP